MKEETINLSNPLDQRSANVFGVDQLLSIVSQRANAFNYRQYIKYLPVDDRKQCVLYVTLDHT